MAFKKIYIPIEPLENHEDFDVWYEDGVLFLHAESDWKEEKSPVKFYSRHGAEMGRVTPGPNALQYDIRVERYTYNLKTYTIFNHYYVKGMLWYMRGTPARGHCNFWGELTEKKDVLVTTTNFLDKGKCYEVKVKDISKLRIAACCIIAIRLKETWRGLSEGEPDVKLGWIESIKRRFLDHGIPYEEIWGDVYPPVTPNGEDVPMLLPEYLRGDPRHL